MAKKKCNSCSNFRTLMRGGWVDSYLCREFCTGILDTIDFDKEVDTDPDSEDYCEAYKEE